MYSMWLEVIQCRRDGLRLKRSQWPAPVSGRLSIYEMPGGPNRHTQRMASLTRPHGVSGAWVGVILPIVGPELLPGPAGQLLIRGIQISSACVAETGTVDIREYEQVWLCTQIACPLPSE